MKALVLQKEGLFYTEELPKPSPAAGEALLKLFMQAYAIPTWK